MNRVRLSKIIYKVTDMLLHAVFILSVVIILSCFITKITTGEATLFGIRPLYIPTGSMEPTIHEGSFALAVPVDAKDVNIGDIIVYKGTLAGIDAQIVHRVVNIDKDIYYFKGDHNDNMDAPVNADQIKYKVVFY